MEERRKRGKEAHVEVTTVEFSVTQLAREAGLSEAVANSTELLNFTGLIVDMVMVQSGHAKVAERGYARAAAPAPGAN